MAFVGLAAGRSSSSEAWRLFVGASAALAAVPGAWSCSSPSSCSSSEEHRYSSQFGRFRGTSEVPQHAENPPNPQRIFGKSSEPSSRLRSFFRQAAAPAQTARLLRCEERSPRVCVIGDVFVDIMAKVPALPKWDSDTEADFVKVLPGGSALNQARHLHGLDMKVDFIGSLGNDSFGKMLRRHCEEQGFSTKWIKDFDLPSSVCMVLVGASDRAFVSCYSTTNAFSTDTVKEASEVLANASHLHLGGYFNVSGLHNDEFTEIVRSHRAHGMTFSINTQYDASEAWLGKDKHLLSLLPLTDFLIVNEIEAKNIAQAAFKTSNPDALVNAHPNMTLVMTRGSAGVDIIRNGKEPLHVGSKRLKEVVDATGAGDAFLAGFLSVILQPKNSVPLEDRLRMASERGHQVAAVCVMREGACVEPVRSKDVE